MKELETVKLGNKKLTNEVLHSIDNITEVMWFTNDATIGEMKEEVMDKKMFEPEEKEGYKWLTVFNDDNLCDWSKKPYLRHETDYLLTKTYSLNFDNFKIFSRQFLPCSECVINTRYEVFPDIEDTLFVTIRNAKTNEIMLKFALTFEDKTGIWDIEVEPESEYCSSDQIILAQEAQEDLQ